MPGIDREPNENLAEHNIRDRDAACDDRRDRVFAIVRFFDGSGPYAKMPTRPDYTASFADVCVQVCAVSLGLFPQPVEDLKRMGLFVIDRSMSGLMLNLMNALHLRSDDYMAIFQLLLRRSEDDRSEMQAKWCWFTCQYIKDIVGHHAAVQRLAGMPYGHHEYLPRLEPGEAMSMIKAAQSSSCMVQQGFTSFLATEEEQQRWLDLVR